MVAYCRIKNLITGRYLCDINLSIIVFNSTENAVAYMLEKNLNLENYEVRYSVKAIKTPKWINKKYGGVKNEM